MKKCLCRPRFARKPGVTFTPVHAATVPKAGFPQRTSYILAGPKLIGPKPFLPERLVLSSKGYAETLSLFVERFTQAGIPAVLCLAKSRRCLYPTRTNA
jgi:hypothetical protein